MIVLNGIRVRTCKTIAAAPATPPPPAAFNARTKSKLDSYETPRPEMAMAAAMGTEVMRIT